MKWLKGLIAALEIPAALRDELEKARAADSDGGEVVTLQEYTRVGAEMLRRIDAVHPIPGGLPPVPEFISERPTSGGIYWFIPDGYNQEQDTAPLVVLVAGQPGGLMTASFIGSDSNRDVSGMIGMWQGPITPF
jgi:hypothetical protein